MAEEVKARKLEAPKWRSMNDVPSRLRRVRGARVSVGQRNSIDKRAYEIGFYTETAFVPDRKRAEAEFAIRHEIQNGLWVEKKKGGK